jgi:hypothetical protein
MSRVIQGKEPRIINKHPETKKKNRPGTSR